MSDVVYLFCSISDSIAAIYDDILPKDFLQQIITVFTTTSVDQFNKLFTKLCNNLIAIELQSSIYSIMVQASVLNPKNNTKVVYYVLR